MVTNYFNMTDKTDGSSTFKDVLDLLTGNTTMSKKMQLGVIQICTLGFLMGSISKVIRSLK